MGPVPITVVVGAMRSLPSRVEVLFGRRTSTACSARSSRRHCQETEGIVAHIVSMRYHRVVPRVRRIVTAAALALAVSAVPLVADRCAATCEAAHAAGTTSCHRASSSGSHVGDARGPCGHNHHPFVVADATTTPTGSRAVTSPVGPSVDPAACAPPLVVVGTPTGPRFDTPSPLLPLTLSSSLRI